MEDGVHFFCLLECIVDETLTLTLPAASGKCRLNDFVIGTVRSGNTRAGATEWNVEIVNNCNCAQSNVLVSCQGFQTVEPINPTIFLSA